MCDPFSSPDSPLLVVKCLVTFKTSSTGDDPAEEMREERMRKPSNVTAREISVECASFALPLRCCVMTIKVFTINIIGDCW